MQSQVDIEQEGRSCNDFKVDVVVEEAVSKSKLLINQTPDDDTESYVDYATTREEADVNSALVSIYDDLATREFKKTPIKTIDESELNDDSIGKHYYQHFFFGRELS